MSHHDAEPSSSDSKHVKNQHQKAPSSSVFKWGAVFAAQAFLSVAAGAFGAHGLADVLDAKALGWWHTASQYLMYHALAGLVAVALSAYLASTKNILRLFCIGNLFFAGSLYVMALTGYTLLGVVTPLGGICYLVGWGLLVVSLWRVGRRNS